MGENCDRCCGSPDFGLHQIAKLLYLPTFPWQTADNPTLIVGIRQSVFQRGAGAVVCNKLKDWKANLPILSNSSGNRHRAVLLPLGLLMLSMAVFGWGLQYKLSLYQGKDSITHLTPEAKLLSQKERPAAGQPLTVRPAELQVFPALLMLVLVFGLHQVSALFVRSGSMRRVRTPLPPCLQAIFLRPPPVLT